VVVWETKDTIKMDFEGTTDIYSRVFFDSNNAQETDTHFRCSTGKGSFNYRLLFDIQEPAENNVLSIQLWDKDIFSSNEIIGDASLNLKLPITDAGETEKPIYLTKKYYESYLKQHMNGGKMLFHNDDSFWIDCIGKDKNVSNLT
jgi:hypothetical protein